MSTSNQNRAVATMENTPKTQTTTDHRNHARHRAGNASRLVALTLATLCMTGCWHANPRHGLILRGDWSFEVNRIPWMAGHNDCYQQPAPPCGVPCGDPSCGPGAGPACDPDACGPAPPGAEGCAGPACRSKGYCLGPHGQAAAPEGPDESCIDYGNHPRFHPVPTQPVFSPRGPMSGGMQVLSPQDCGPISRHLEDATIPEPEVIPPPSPKPKAESPKDDSPAAKPRLLKTTSQSAWIFTPAPDPDVEASLANKRTAAARSALR